MTNYKEIVTKAIISKGKKLFTSSNSVLADHPSTILGCWVINHKFQGYQNHQQIIIDGEYDVHIWYSSFDDTKTNIIQSHDTYHEVIQMKDRDYDENEEIVVRSLKQPNCVKVDIDGDHITYTIEKELGVELIGDINVKIEVDSMQEEDSWDEIVEEKEVNQTVDEINQVKEDFMEDTL